MDGACLGISFDAQGNVRAQNRGAYVQLPGTGQWKQLGQWVEARRDGLFDTLLDRYILFGEWCYAQHSVRYDRLPDWFLAFDLYDRQAGKFVATKKRDPAVAAMGLAKVPGIAQGQFQCGELQAMLAQSQLADAPAEGLYLRLEQGGWLEQRAKLVRAGFIQAIGQHWSARGLKPNRLAYSA